MKNLLCVDCSICPIRKECDEIDDIIGVNKTLVGEHSLLTQIYAKGRADAIEPIIKIEEDARKYGHTDAYELVQIRRYLKQLKEQNHEKE